MNTLINSSYSLPYGFTRHKWTRPALTQAKQTDTPDGWNAELACHWSIINILIGISYAQINETQDIIDLATTQVSK